MTELHLFAGAGGGILGGLLLGHARSVPGNRPYCWRCRQGQRDGMLPDFPIHDDIRRSMARQAGLVIALRAAPLPGHQRRRAGRHRGERSGLWREMARVVGEVRPRFVFSENPPALSWTRTLPWSPATFAALGQ